MAEFRKPAVKIMQGKRVLFLTSLTVRDFMANEFYRVEKLDVRESTGMQRLLDTKRARRFGEDIIGADELNEAFLPTSVFLATDGDIGYDESTKELFFNSDARAGVCPLDVVDGQHRIKGLEYAAEKEPRLLDFPVSAVIAPNMSEAEKMLQFVVVNTKQQPVNQGVAQHITARFTKMLEVVDLPYLPNWLRKQAAKGDDERALDIAKDLNSESNSPWCGRIQFADEAKSARHTINQATFVKSIKRIILPKNHPINVVREGIRIPAMINYWKAVSDICVASAEDSGDAGARTVVFKYTGLEFFHLVFVPVLLQLAKNRTYTESAMKSCLLSVQSYLPSEAAVVLSPEYWQSGGPASGLNRGGMQKMAAVCAEAFTEVDNDEVQV